MHVHVHSLAHNIHKYGLISFIIKCGVGGHTCLAYIHFNKNN